ncbi:MAG: hypothetical protein GY774_05495 [Planctomycetes bacterium]|nr:hypothetical protein [Planctomycetota bacterium]
MHLLAAQRGVLLAIVSLLVVTVCIFWQVGHCEFTIYDDDRYVTDNPYVTAGITRESVAWAFTSMSGNTGYWHPLTWLSHMLDCQLFDLDASWHHRTNLLLHVTNTLLIFILLMRMTAKPWCSAWIAAAFALHPCQVETVAWVAERKDLLSTLFVLLTMFAYFQYVKHRTFGHYFLTVFIYMLALMCKPMSITLPLLLLLLDYWPLERLQIVAGEGTGPAKGRPLCIGPNMMKVWAIVKDKIPFFVLSGAICVVTLYTQKNQGVLWLNEELPLGIRIANSLFSYLAYIEKMIWPSGLTVVYPYRDLEMFTLWRVALAFLLLSGVFICILRWGQCHRYLTVGWFWYIVVLLPVIGIIQTTEQAMAIRYTYLSYVGLFMMFAWGSADILRQWPSSRQIIGLLAVVILLMFSVCTLLQLRHWRNSLTLFEHAVKVTKGNYIAHHNLAHILEQQGKMDEATAHDREAVRIKPDFWRGHFGLGFYAYKRRDLYEAQEHLVRAMKYNPHSVMVGDILMRVKYALSVQREQNNENPKTTLEKLIDTKQGDSG